MSVADWLLIIPFKTVASTNETRLRETLVNKGAAAWSSPKKKFPVTLGLGGTFLETLVVESRVRSPLDG